MRAAIFVGKKLSPEPILTRTTLDIGLFTFGKL